jgi:hypothetical protein
MNVFNELFFLLGVVLDCFNTTVPKYDGHQQTSKYGTPCLRWDHFNSFSKFPDATQSDAANFCRAPDGYSTPWCYIAYPDRWEDCGINKCGEQK